MTYSFTDNGTPRYMGGRRNLTESLSHIIEEHILLKSTQSHVLDMCSGSAILSRMLRQSGWVVHAQDSEPYAYNWANYILQTNYADINSQLNKFYQIWGVKWEDSENIYQNYKQSFLQDHYTLQSRCKRNMYNVNAAITLDQLWEWSTDTRWQHTPLLNTFLKYEIQRLMILHSNTNGTLNSWHNTHTMESSRRKDIKQKPVLDYPWAIPGVIGTAYQKDALDTTDNRVYDLIVFDPPQTIHQYSSCYHLLNAYATNNITAPLDTAQGGTKAGINHTTNSSSWNKPTKHKEELKKWINAWKDKTKWIISIQQQNSFCSAAEYQEILSCSGTQQVKTIIESNATFHIIQTTKKNNRPYKKIVDLRKTKIQDIRYLDPEKLPDEVKALAHPRGWCIVQDNSVIARIGYSLKVCWSNDYKPSTIIAEKWRYSNVTINNRFLWLLSHKYWAPALNCLIAHKKELPHDFEKYWYMLWHLIISHGAHKTVQKMKRLKAPDKTI